MLTTHKLNENKSALIIFCSAEDSERVTKILRSFGVHPLNIPSNMPQNPKTAYREAQTIIKDLDSKLTEINKHIEKTRHSILTKILSLHEASKAAKEVLEVTRKPPGTRHFAIIQGFIPVTMQGKFKDLTKEYVCVVEQADSAGNQNSEISNEEITFSSYK